MSIVKYCPVWATKEFLRRENLNIFGVGGKKDEITVGSKQWGICTISGWSNKTCRTCNFVTCKLNSLDNCFVYKWQHMKSVCFFTYHVVLSKHFCVCLSVSLSLSICSLIHHPSICPSVCLYIFKPIQIGWIVLTKNILQVFIFTSPLAIYRK